jgi:chemotaxis response regulator CheB
MVEDANSQDREKTGDGLSAVRLVVASWDKVDSARKFLEALPPNCRAAFFLPALPEEALADLAETPLPVAVGIAEAGAAVLPAHAYLPPAGKHLSVDGGLIKLSNRLLSGHPVGHFVGSLPPDRQGRTAVVFLPGATDGERARTRRRTFRRPGVRGASIRIRRRKRGFRSGGHRPDHR